MTTPHDPVWASADAKAGQPCDDAPADVDANPGRVWLALVEQGARSDALQRRLEVMERSKSWRLTAPLRALVRRLDQWRGRLPARPVLRAAPGQPAGIAPAQRIPSWMQALLPVAGDARPRLLVDVTELSLEDLGAGVQRVTRRILAELLLAPPSGWVVTPVRLSVEGHFCVAGEFLAGFLGLPANALGGDQLVEARPGDRFLGLDFCRDRAAALDAGLGQLRDAGVPVALTVPDVLPLSDPGWFPPGIAASYEQWLRVLATRADRALCISADAAAALRHQLEARGLPLPAQGISLLRLGADLPPVPAPAVETLPARAEGTTRVLMVGTLEPRKSHAQALDALDVLWGRGLPFELVIAGHPGWMVDALLERIVAHPECGQRLHWIEGPDDRTLAALYQGCDVLLMASRGEGFGLPVAEAGRMGLGLVLRDLAVFREVAGQDARYFSGDTGEAIADALFAQREHALAPRPRDQWGTWADCARSVCDLLELPRPAAGPGATRLKSQETP